MDIQIWAEQQHLKQLEEMAERGFEPEREQKVEDDYEEEKE